MSNFIMSSTDPGEGQTLADDNYLAVYGGTSLLDIFYPVGTYYETSNTSFDPNVAWGGVWVEDSTGRVTVSRDSGTFDTVGATGGNETNTHQHWQTVGSDGSATYDIRIDDSHPVSGLNSRVISRYRIMNQATNASNTSTRQHTTYNETIDILQPYVVVKRWHRIN